MRWSKVLSCVIQETGFPYEMSHSFLQANSPKPKQVPGFIEYLKKKNEKQAMESTAR